MASGDHAEPKVTFLKGLLDSPVKDRLKGILKEHIFSSTWLTSFTFESSNAAFDGPSFSEASCSMIDNADGVHVGSFFERGLEIVKNYIEEQKLPETDDETDALYFLTQYLTSEDDHKAIEQIRKPISETAFSIVLANHLLSKLSVDKRYLLDKKTAGKYERMTCPCGCCVDMEEHFGDTSIGDTRVWHGNLDIVLFGSAILVVPRPESFVEVIKDKGSVQSFSQFVAQTVVFSFYQHAKFPDKKSLVPSIVIGGQQFRIAMYDSENDIFLLSKPLKLLSDHFFLLDSAIFCIWLVLNYRMLGSGFPKCDKPITKANFFKTAQKKLDVYQSCMKFGSVEGAKKRKLFGDHPKDLAPAELEMSANFKKLKEFYVQH